MKTQILTDADSEQVVLVLIISPSDGLDYTQLADWYRRHGFRQGSGGGCIGVNQFEEGNYENTCGTLAERLRDEVGQVYEASITFFNPNCRFVELIKRLWPNHCFVDCGAGLGSMTTILSKAGLDGIAIDLYPSSKASILIIPIDATRLEFVQGMLPIIARPSRGGWIRKTIDNAVGGAGIILYVGLEKHYQEDLEDLPYDVSLIASNVGEDNECVWRIEK